MSSAAKGTSPADAQPTMSPLGRMATGSIRLPSRRSTRVWWAPQASCGQAATSAASQSGSRGGSCIEPLVAEQVEEVVDLEHLVGLRVHASAGAEGDGELGDGGRVGRLDDVDEVVRPEEEPLVDDLCTQLLDVFVDLADSLGVRAQRLQALLAQRRQHQVLGHVLSLARGRWCPVR